jgi:acetylornithine/succinyldiaminopimelate/putrescine aminotransferase
VLAPVIDAGVVATTALAEGLVVNPVTPTSLRLAPSLLVGAEEIDEAVARLGRALRAGIGEAGQ